MITVAVCTWNRAAMLDRLLRAFRALTIPPAVEWEVLVVNNNCTDTTDDILATHSSHLPLRRAFEPTPGIAHARNRALTEAKGNLILWTDDDMAVPPEWLANYHDAATQFPAASLFGGPIRLGYDASVSAAHRQFAESNLKYLSPIFGVLDFGPEVRPLKNEEFIFSGNLGLRTVAARRFRFDGRFGRVGRDGLLGGEETLFLKQMRDAGEQGVWVGTAPAEHFIPAERLTREFAWNYFVGVGRTQVRFDGIRDCPTLFGRPRWAVLQVRRNRAKAWLARQTGGKWLGPYLAAAKLTGYLEECDAHRHDRRPGYLVPTYRDGVHANA